MAFTQIVADLTKRRPEAKPYGYLAALIVIVFFIALGHDEALTSMLPYFALLLLCVVQIFLRTAAGWFVFVCLSIWFTVEIAFDPDLLSGPRLDYVVGLACGVVPAGLLLAFPPFRRQSSRLSTSA